MIVRGSYRAGVGFGSFGKMHYGGRMVRAFIIECSQCPRIEGFPMKPTSRAEIARKKPEQNGWKIIHGGREALCPGCSAPKSTCNQQKESIVKANVKSAPAAQAPALSFVDEIKIATAIQESWNNKLGCYKAGISDKSLGDEFRKPWGVIAGVREKLGLRIVTDPEIAAIEALQGDLLNRLAAIDTQIATLKRQRGL